jgi:hypothetical protein
MPVSDKSLSNRMVSLAFLLNGQRELRLNLVSRPAEAEVMKPDDSDSDDDWIVCKVQ